MPNHPPVDLLLTGGAARPRPWLAALTGFTMVYVPSLLLQHGRGTQWLDLYQQVGVLLALAAVVAWLAGRDVAKLFSLHRGRAMEEIVQAGYSLEDVLEALGWQSGRRAVVHGWPAAAGILLAGVLATPHLADLVLVEGLLWVPAAAAAAAAAVWIAGYLPGPPQPKRTLRLDFENPILYREAGAAVAPTVACFLVVALWSFLPPSTVILGVAALTALSALGLRASERETRTEEALQATPSTRQERTSARVAILSVSGWIALLPVLPQALPLALVAPCAGALVGLAAAEGATRQRAFGRLALWVLGAATAWVGLLGGVLALATWSPAAVPPDLLEAAPVGGGALALGFAALLAARALRNPEAPRPPERVVQSHALAVAIASGAATALVLGLHGAAWLADLQERTQFALLGAGVAILFVAPALALLAWVGAPTAAVLGLRVPRLVHGLVVGAVSGAVTWGALLLLRVLEFYHLRPSAGAFQSYQPLNEPVGLAMLLGAIAALAVAVTQRPPSVHAAPSLRRPLLQSGLRAAALVVCAGVAVQAWLLSAATPEQVPQRAVRHDTSAFADLAAERDAATMDDLARQGRLLVLEERVFASGHPEVSLESASRASQLLWALAASEDRDGLRAFLQASRPEVPPAELFRQALVSQGARAAVGLREAARPDGWLASWYTAPVARLLVERELRVMARDLERAAQAAGPLLAPGASPFAHLEPVPGTPFAPFLQGLDDVVDQWRWRFTKRELLRAAAAAQLYRLERGRYPDSLAELAPVYLPEAPRSYVGGFVWQVEDGTALLGARDPRPGGPHEVVELGGATLVDRYGSWVLDKM